MSEVGTDPSFKTEEGIKSAAAGGLPTSTAFQQRSRGRCGGDTHSVAL